MCTHADTHTQDELRWLTDDTAVWCLLEPAANTNNNICHLTMMLHDCTIQTFPIGSSYSETKVFSCYTWHMKLKKKKRYLLFLVSDAPTKRKVLYRSTFLSCLHWRTENQCCSQLCKPLPTHRHTEPLAKSHEPRHL